MSEFKYACPVCGQHMLCDSSQGGSVMECPTCFQKVIAPQAPATSDPKFILTGTKAGERPAPPVAWPGSAVPHAPKSFPLGTVLLVVVLGAAAAGAYVFREKIFQRSPATPAPQKVAPITLPPASDTNWVLNLDAVTTPAAPAVGRVHGQSSTLDRVIFQGGVLTFRPSVHGSPDVNIAINFGGVLPEALAGQTINVMTNADQAARVTLHWKDNGQNARDNFDKGYALRLELGALANNRIPGKIYFCAPDNLKSYVMGTFNAEVRKPRPKK